MKTRIFRMLAISMVSVMFSTGCMMSRLVDRAFLGISVQSPHVRGSQDHGRLPPSATFVVDVATFPIQALLVVILGDNFPFHDPPDALSSMQASLRGQPALQEARREGAEDRPAELSSSSTTRRSAPNTALALSEDGHWTVVELTADTREQLIARAQQPEAPETLVCAAE